MGSLVDTSEGVRRVAHDPDWPREFEAERERIGWVLGGRGHRDRCWRRGIQRTIEGGRGTMTEAQFGEALASRIRERIGPELEVETKRSLLYALWFDDEGRLRLGLNRDGEPVRGGGTGFEQDVLIFNRSARGDTSIVPRVVIE